MEFRTSLLWFLLVGFSLSAAFRIHQKEDIVGSCVKCHETDPNKINVHLVHHSHDDVGWLKTMDEYYWGLNYTYENVGVQYIITSVVNALWENPDRRFIQVETAFFWKWWKTQNDGMRIKFKTLVENGQLEIVNGAWSMNDEACVNYQSTIDQFTWGFRVLNDTLGQCGYPTIGWQIDPFGHSREHASILSKIGFDGLFFARMDNNDREQRIKDGNMDFLWKSSANRNDSVLFTSMIGFDHLYYPPIGFCFDVICGDDSIVDDPDEDAYNLDTKVNDFAEDIKKYSTYVKTNNVLITMGGDFQYQAADINFENSEKLIRAFENHTDIKLIYSTPSCYLKAVYEGNPTLTTTTDDFFPYGSADHTYWAGYFTSKQNFKRFERIGHNTLQVAKQLNTFVSAINRSDVNVESFRGLREALGVVQHHDAITGTEKDHVAHDYAKILARAIGQAEAPFAKLIGELVNVDLPTIADLASCPLANISVCSTTQSADQFLVVLYNPLSWTVRYPVRLPVEGDSFSVIGANGIHYYTDVVTPISNFSYVDLDGVQSSKRELVFIPTIPPLGVTVCHVNKTTKTENSINQKFENTFKFGNDKVGFEIDNSTNLLKSVTMNGETLQITQQFLYYISHNGTNDSDPSGAYVFRPDGEAIAFDNPTILSRTQGQIVDEVHQRINDWITQVIRVYVNFNYVEFDWLVGPLNISDDRGIEIISRFTVDNFKNNETFYTDSNGRETIQRILNYRPTYTYNSSIEPIASNYYPVTSKIVIRDEQQKLQVAVLNDRSQGGSSLGEGQIELMVHRRTLRDDSKGVNEPLNETEFGQGIVARGQHYLVLGPSDEIIADGKTVTAQERTLAQQKLLQPWIGVADAGKIPDTLVYQLVNLTYSGLKQDLPENINLLTLEPWTDSSYIVRLEHILEKDEDPNLSSSVTVDLAGLFSGFNLTNIVETTLGANWKLNSFKPKYDWSSQGRNFENHEQSLSASEVVLAPMDIRTFIVELS